MEQTLTVTWVDGVQAVYTCQKWECADGLLALHFADSVQMIPMVNVRTVLVENAA